VPIMHSSSHSVQLLNSRPIPALEFIHGTLHIGLIGAVDKIEPGLAERTAAKFQ